MIDVSVILPVKLSADAEWLIELTEFAINTMRMHTKRKFQLIILESSGRELKGLADIHVKCAADSNYVKDFNSGIDIADGKYIVHVANDIIVGPEWLEALLEPFERIKDCGASTISVAEPGAIVGSRDPSRQIIEGMYGPLMMFPAGWKFDEAFSGLHSDSDLIMRIYQAGLRSYRNHRAMAYHLDGLTWRKNTNEKTRADQRREADMLFRARYKDSPLWMAKMILRGGVIYGREHEA